MSCEPAGSRFILNLLLARYVDAGQAASDRDETEFLHWVKRYGARLPEALQPEPRHPVE